MYTLQAWNACSSSCRGACTCSAISLFSLLFVVARFPFLTFVAVVLSVRVYREDETAAEKGSWDG
jgi:hypothetical protein